MFELITILTGKTTDTLNPKHRFFQNFLFISDTITNEYIERARQEIHDFSREFSANEIMESVNRLSNELKLKAAWCRDTYRVDKGYTSMYLGRHCNQIINKCVTYYIQQVKRINAANKFVVACG